MDHRIQSYQKQEICQEKILKPSLSGNWIIIGQPILAGKNYHYEERYGWIGQNCYNI